METVFEGIMLTLFCFAAVILIFRFAKNKSKNLKLDRAIAITMDIGFVAGAIRKLIVAPAEWTFALYVICAYLFYIAVLLSFPNLGKDLEENIYE